MAIKFAGDIDLGLNYLINVHDITSGDPGSHAANKSYVDATLASVTSGLDWKQSVRAASFTNVTVTAPGAALDGVTLSAPNHDRVLLMGQTAPAENGIWEFNGAASALTRPQDASNPNVSGGLAVSVEEGTVNADRTFVLVSDGAIDVDTDPQAYTFLGMKNVTAGGGLSIDSNYNVEVNPGLGILVETVDNTNPDYDKVAIDPAVVAQKVYSQTIGDGTATTFTLPHGLGHPNVWVQLFETATGENVGVEVGNRTNTDVDVVFPAPPASNEYTALVLG
jgi:hypothetical protein